MRIFVAAMEQEAREIVGDITNKEFLVWRAVAGTMPWLNCVFEELGIHHTEHKVPAKVLKSMEDKARKDVAKNDTTTAKLKKRKGTGVAKAVSKKRKIDAASTGASADTAEEVTENFHGGSASMATDTEGEHSTASTDLGCDDFVQAALGGMVGSTAAEASIMAPMPCVLGDESSSSKGGDGGGGNASTPNEAEARSAGCRPSMASLVEESEDESPSTWPINLTSPIGSWRGGHRYGCYKRYFIFG